MTLLMLCTSIVEARPQWGVVRRVLQADTILLERGEKIKLLGLEVPEAGSPYYADAYAATRRLLDKKEVRLRYGLRERDSEGNWLAYVFTEDGLVNEKLIRDGLAWVSDIPNEEEYLKDFTAAEATAKKKKRGLWSEFDSEEQPVRRERKKELPWATSDEIKKGIKK